MKVQVEIGERIRNVEILPQGSSYGVLVDGRPRLVHAVQVGPDTWSLIVRDSGAVQSVKVVVSPRRGHGALDVYVEGLHIPAQIRNGRGRRAADGPAAGGSAAQRIVAPMPGKVVRMLTEVGAEVKARQGVVIVEAMKMENEVRTLRAGRVSEVLAVEGQLVDAGTTLVIVE
jgi:biotin carboxyl carrier protein